MASDPTRIAGKQVRVIFPDGLPRGLDASQVKLVVHNPQRESGGGAVNAQLNRDGNGVAADNPTFAPLPGQNEPEPVAAGACPAAPLPPQDEAVPLSPPSSLLSPDGASAPPRRSRSEAARENGRRSRGPITPEGKARSSQNALKHGLSSRRIVIGEEEEEEWLDFRDECRQTLKPVGAIELGYADEFAASRWRLRRCLGIETSIFDYQFAMQKIYDEEKCSAMDGIDRTGMAFKSAKDDLTALGRYETRIRRSGERALANLFKLQSMRQNEPNRGADAPVPEPAPEPVQPGEHSAAALQNEPKEPPAPDDSTESITAEGPRATVSPQPSYEPRATRHEPATSPTLYAEFSGGAIRSGTGAGLA